MNSCDLEQMKCRTEACLQSVSDFRACMTGQMDSQHPERTVWEKMKASPQTSIVVRYVTQLQKDCDLNLLGDIADTL